KGGGGDLGVNLRGHLNLGGGGDNDGSGFNLFCFLAGGGAPCLHIGGGGSSGSGG
ncbi:hypothetical protein Csa_018824, partial [Cucumis sativus]